MTNNRVTYGSGFAFLLFTSPHAMRVPLLLARCKDGLLDVKPKLSVAIVAVVIAAPAIRPQIVSLEPAKVLAAIFVIFNELVTAAFFVCVKVNNRRGHRHHSGRVGGGRRRVLLQEAAGQARARP
jgi:hypothetical protein